MWRVIYRSGTGSADIAEERSGGTQQTSYANDHNAERAGVTGEGICPTNGNWQSASVFSVLHEKQGKIL